MNCNFFILVIFCANYVALHFYGPIMAECSLDNVV